MTTTKFHEHVADFEACRQIIKRASKSFYAAFSQLPVEEALSVYAVYAFCRQADDLIDENQDLAGLDVFEEQLRAFEAGQVPDHFIWRALAVVFQHYSMHFQPFYDMIEGQRMDMAFRQPETQDDLSRYAYHVAGTVGLMLLPILSEQPDACASYARDLGEAMQVTNILRDIGEDRQKGRIYLPADKMQTFGVHEKDLDQEMLTKPLIELWENQAKHAEDLYEHGLGIIPLVKAETRLALLSAIYYYRAILDACRQSGYQVLTKRQSISALEKAKLLVAVKADLKKYN
ncbi:phytoene/squalene synthase family protein [Streptococcus moroccensis]|uniref:Phytoene synthase n=1 Tax=Streptococcus moroccensis TaxID=1451356 RepID=A0ABT9YPP4_9STRE|nr:phytoene/squalene synthase family protein [Streptococcus moroccensis]MDQ0221948.1 phytoene synthase [Streptococcus moroccensis]